MFIKRHFFWVREGVKSDIFSNPPIGWSENAILYIPKFQVGGRRIHSPGTNIPAIQGSGTLLTAEVVELYIVPK